MIKKVSLQYISESLNISKGTISLVLNGKGHEKRISKETQERILKFAKDHNYKANQLARGLSRGKSDMIGLVIPNISDSFYARIARRIERIARKTGYNVVFSSTGENQERETELIESMLNRQVDGLIIASSQKNQEDIMRLKRNNFPFVLIDRFYPEVETNFVGVDNVGGITKAVDHLVKLGRKKVGFITLACELEVMCERLEGYRQTMDKYKLPVQQGFVHTLDLDNLEGEMPQAIKRIIQFPTSIEGIVFSTHYLAAAGLRELNKLNIRIPEDVAIISFGQMSAFDLTDPPITSVIQPTDLIGDQAVDILMQNMHEDSFSLRHVRLDTSFIVRKSCGTLLQHSDI